MASVCKREYKASKSLLSASLSPLRHWTMSLVMSGVPIPSPGIQKV